MIYSLVKTKDYKFYTRSFGWVFSCNYHETNKKKKKKEAAEFQALIVRELF